MSPEQATYRYLWVFIPAICVYAAGSIFVVSARDSSDLTSTFWYVVALVPIIAIFVSFWAHWRFTCEVDEFLRLIQVKGTLVGTAFVMIVASGWGTLEMLTDAPNLPVFWLLPVFWVTQAATTVLISKRQGVF